MKFTKRIATLLMALAMMLCLTVPAFAAEPAAQAKLIVSGDQLKGKTVHATKMFTASWVDSNNDGKIDARDKLSYTLDTAWEGLFWANGLSTGNACPEGSINVSEQAGATLNEKALAYLNAMTEDSTELNTFAAKAAKYKTTNTIADTKTAIGGEDNTAILDMKTKYADKADKAITVTYSATLNKDAVVGIEGNKNEAKVEYQNGPATDNHGTSNPSITTTRTYPVKVQKHAFEDTADTTSVLAGAKFALSTSEAVPTFTKGVDGSYTLDTSDTNVVRLVGSDATYRVAEKNDEAGAVTYFTTVSTSATTINGLKAGIYYLHEIEAPEGYNKLTAPVKVEIIETKDETSGNVTSVTYKVNDGTASDDSNVKIDNKTGSMLPSTGGMGTIGLTVLGVGVVALGVLAPKKKKEKQ